MQIWNYYVTLAIRSPAVIAHFVPTHFIWQECAYESTEALLYY